jgi:hypothetical protein
MAKSSYKDNISNQISIKRRLLESKQKAGKLRLEALEEQLRIKKEQLRITKRRISPNFAPNLPDSSNREDARLNNKLVRENENEIKALQKEIEFAKRDNQLELAAIRQEIKQLEAEKRVHAASTPTSLIALAERADLEKNFELADELQLAACRKINL